MIKNVSNLFIRNYFIYYLHLKINDLELMSNVLQACNMNKNLDRSARNRKVIVIVL